MDWFEPIDGYCERLDPSYWAEPVNALTNLAFVLAALFMAQRVRGSGLMQGYALCLILGLIGVGSYLFHTHATGWSALADVGFITLFILVYLFLASRDFLNLSALLSLGMVVLFFPFTAALTPLFSELPLLGTSAAYVTVALLIALYGLYLLKKQTETARGLLIGAALLLVSITLRSLDIPLCEVIPVGTHFTWHLLNSVMLAWMIEVYRRHMLAHHTARC